MHTNPLPDEITVYGSYLVFQLFSHKDLYEDSNADIMKSTEYAPHRSFKKYRADRAEMKALKVQQKANPDYVPPARLETPIDVEATAADIHEEEEPETPLMGVYMTLGLLVIVTVVCSLAPSHLW